MTGHVKNVKAGPVLIELEDIKDIACYEMTRSKDPLKSEPRDNQCATWQERSLHCYSRIKVLANPEVGLL